MDIQQWAARLPMVSRLAEQYLVSPPGTGVEVTVWIYEDVRNGTFYYQLSHYPQAKNAAGPYYSSHISADTVSGALDLALTHIAASGGAGTRWVESMPLPG